MGIVRHFGGHRDDDGKKNIAATIMRLEFEKKGRLEPAERFKLIMKMKMDAARKEHAAKKGNSRPMSAKAEKALKDVAARKAAKQAKALRQMVIVQPQIYSNGRLTKKGVVYDIAGNVIAKVNKKNGKMYTNLGGALGKYKPKSQYVNMVLTNAINLHSPYFINLRKMQMLQAAGLDPVTGQPLNQNAINVHGNSNAMMHGAGYTAPSAHHDYSADHGSGGATFDNTYGEAAGGPRQNIGMTAWGAMSDNVWGTYTDTVWGTSMDTVWGTNQSDVWGGIGGNPYGAVPKSVHIWGTGSGKNYIMPIVNSIRKLFGIPLAETVRAFKQYRQGTTEHAALRTRGGTEHAVVRSVASEHAATTRAPAPRSGK